MSESAPPNLGELLRGLPDDRGLDAPDLRSIEARLDEIEHARGTPWYLQPFIFGGALLAAAMLTVGVAALLELRFDGGVLLGIGATYLVGAIVLHRVGGNAFLDYLGLSCSIGGHGFLLAGAADLADTGTREMALLVAAAGLCLLLYGIYRDFLHRLCSCLLVFGTAKLAFPAAEIPDALHGLVAMAAAACAWILTRPRENPTWRPLAYACGLGLLVLLLPIGDRGLWFEDAELPHRYISSATMGVAVLWASRFAARRSAVGFPPTHLVLGLLLIVGLCSLSTPGIPAAVFLIVLGHAAYHWPIAVLGMASLPIFVWQYYYNLELDFMTKSGVLAGSGVLLLLARVLVARRLFSSTSRRPGDDDHDMGDRRATSRGIVMTTTHKSPLLLLTCNLAVFLGVANWAAWDKELHLSQGRVILLEIMRFDPRSLMQGDYMALRYPISVAIDHRLAADARGDGQVVVAIDADDVGHFRRMFDGGALASDEHLLHYRVRWGRANRARVAAEEFFFQEGMAAEFERARYAELRVTDQGHTLLVALRDAERRRIGGEQR